MLAVSAYPFGESCLVGVTRYLRFGPTFCTSVCSSGSDLVTLTLTGWNRAGDALILDHLQIWGSPDDDQTWGELALLRSNWRHPWGEHLRVDATVVDSGAWTQRVHDFCFPRLARRIWAGKGVAGHHPILAPSRGKVNGARGRLFIIGFDTMHAVATNRRASARRRRRSWQRPVRSPAPSAANQRSHMSLLPHQSLSL